MKSTRPNAPSALAAALAFAALLAAAPPAPAQRRDAGVWNPAAPKPARKPARKPAAPRRQPAPRARTLAVQYRLLKVNDNGSQVEVSPVTVFNGGDRLRLAVKADDDVYVYVIHQRGPGSPGSVYFPDTRFAVQNHLRKGEQLVFPSGCAGEATPSRCSHEIGGASGQEFFTLVFSRSENVPLFEQAVGPGGTITAEALDTHLGPLVQNLDSSARGDTVFARSFRSLNSKSADMVVVRLVLTRRG